MSVTRSLLDCLGRDSLVRLIYERGLPTSRENDERRETLARSYRGDVEALIDELSQAELVEIFQKLVFHVDGADHYLSNPGKYRRDELRAFAIRAFAGRRVQVAGEFRRVEQPACADDVSSPVSNDDGGLEPEPFASVANDWSRPRKLARVVGQLGELVPERLRTERFHYILRQLRERGIEACLADDPSASVLTEAIDSPGIAARVRLRRVQDTHVGEHEQELDLGTADELLFDEKVATLGLKREPHTLYVIKNGDVWAVARDAATSAKAKARKVVSTGVAMDHGRYVYYLDGDGDLARKERGSAPRLESTDNNLSLLGWAVIQSDGVVDPREVQELQRVLRDVGQSDRGAAQDLTAVEAALEVARRAPSATKEILIRQLFAIATADGVLADEELRLLTTIEARLLPGSALISTMAEEWCTANEPKASPAGRGDQLIDDILSILHGSATWEQ